MLLMPVLSLRDTACCDKRLTDGAGDGVLVFRIEKKDSLKENTNNNKNPEILLVLYSILSKVVDM